MTVGASLLLLPFLANTNGLTRVPRPTAAQLRYQRHEIAALIHFNMATFQKDGDPGCTKDNWNTKQPYAVGPSSDPKSFNPTKLNTTQWAEVMQNLGAKHAILTAKHGCGFGLWQSDYKFSDGSEYGYDVAGGFGRDVLREFSDSMEQAGIGHGFYYSLTNNFFLNVYKHEVQPPFTLIPNQKNVTQQEFEDLAVHQVEELWSKYGALDEIWFDGGYTGSLKDKLSALLAKYQPNATAFGGDGVSPSPACWVGTESGEPGAELWSTGTDSHGDPASQVFCPKTCDTTLQDGDAWFYKEGLSIRSLSTMIAVYHATVGMNGVLELDFAIDRTGRVHDSHAELYKALGDWVRACYGTPVAQQANRTNEVTLPAGTPIDRVTLSEDIAEGQLIRSFTVQVMPKGGFEWKVVAKGQSVGNKRIVLFDEIDAEKVKVSVDEAVGTPYLSVKIHAPCASE